MENLGVKYAIDKPYVIDGLTVHIAAGERVGIVGRTGLIFSKINYT